MNKYMQIKGEIDRLNNELAKERFFDSKSVNCHELEMQIAYLKDELERAKEELTEEERRELREMERMMREREEKKKKRERDSDYDLER